MSESSDVERREQSAQSEGGILEKHPRMPSLLNHAARLAYAIIKYVYTNCTYRT